MPLSPLVRDREVDAGHWAVRCAVGTEEDARLFLKGAPRGSCRRRAICPAKLGSVNQTQAEWSALQLWQHPAAPGGRLVPPQGAVASETLASQGTDGQGVGNSTKDAGLCQRAGPQEHGPCSWREASGLPTESEREPRSVCP